MAIPIATAIGRVQPIFKGDYNTFSSYSKLDNVLFEGCSFIALRDAPAGQTPDPTQASNAYWQMISQKGNKGDTGDFGAPTAQASGLPYGEPPTVTVTATGPNTAKIFNFEFGLPAGPLAFDAVAASAESLPTGSEAAATASLVESGDETVLTFAFGIPAADGQGAAKVDGVMPDSNREIHLNAVRAIPNQPLNDSQKQYARENINAQIAGNYQPAGNYITDPSASTNQFLYYNNEGEWVGKSINEVPTGASADIGKYLRKSQNGMIWSTVQTLPAGGAEGMPLVKNSIDDYDVTWGTTISSAEIDSIIG